MNSHPRLEKQEILLEILKDFKSKGIKFSVYDCISESGGLLKYEMTNYWLNKLWLEGTLVLLKKRVLRVKRYKFPV